MRTLSSALRAQMSLGESSADALTNAVVSGPQAAWLLNRTSQLCKRYVEYARSIKFELVYSQGSVQPPPKLLADLRRRTSVSLREVRFCV